MKFQFNLARVLTLREREAMAARQALASARSDARKASEALVRARTAREAFAAELERRRTGGMPAWEWAITSQQHAVLVQAEQEAAAALHQSLAEVSVRVSLLARARQKEEALLKLRERKLELFRAAESAREQLVNDELAQRARRIEQGGA